MIYEYIHRYVYKCIYIYIYIYGKCPILFLHVKLRPVVYCTSSVSVNTMSYDKICAGLMCRTLHGFGTDLSMSYLPTVGCVMCGIQFVSYAFVCLHYVQSLVYACV